MAPYHLWNICYYDLFADTIWQKKKELAIPVHKMQPNTLNEIKEQIYKEVPSVFYIDLEYVGVFSH